MFGLALRSLGRKNLIVGDLSGKQSRLLSTQQRRLEGKVTIITGAASGIGKAIAEEFIRNGAKVIITDVQDALGEQTAAQLGPNASYSHCDVTQESEVSAVVDLAVSGHGRLDVMHNNAGVPGPIIPSVTNLDLTDFDKVMQVNLRGALAGMKHAARVMIPNKSGCILCTASITGILTGLAPHPYSVSKFAIIGLMKSMASELGRHGIRVNCISPFAIPTPLALDGMAHMFPDMGVEKRSEILRGTGELQGANCEVEDIAKAAVYLASDDAKYVSGHNLVVDGGFTISKQLGLFRPS
ncbi:hypothetical protein AMTRI_Chr02g264320 [Amborella trichopoda]